MRSSVEYQWYNTRVDTDMLWLDDSLNWDDAFELATSEYNVFGILTTAFFANSHIFLDWFVKLSILDVLFISEVDSNLTASTLFLGMVWDYSLLFSSVLMMLPFLFYSDFQDLVTTVAYYSPELILGLRDFISLLWLSASMNFSPAASFDVYQDVTGTSYAEFIEYLTSFVSFVINVLALVIITRLSPLTNASDAYASRAYFYLYSISTESRLQFEAGLQAFFFVFLYASMMTATFDDDQEELAEFFYSMCFYFFLFTLLYYFYRYSIHYFFFLEASKEGSAASKPFAQFVFDALNIIAFVLRFVVLMGRLNIYDGVDDILDSYYIFMTDFEEEEYFSDAFFSMFSVMSFDTDNNDDRSFLFEDEMDLSADLFSIYFILWGKFAYFWLFILEEIGRVMLALYITYILMFEMNAVNRSYAEDQYFAVKRSN